MDNIVQLEKITIEQTPYDILPINEYIKNCVKKVCKNIKIYVNFF